MRKSGDLSLLASGTVVQRKKSSLGLQATQQHDLSTATSKCHVVQYNLPHMPNDVAGRSQ